MAVIWQMCERRKMKMSVFLKAHISIIDLLQIRCVISQCHIRYRSTIYRDHDGSFYILTVCQYWLGKADPKNVFRSILTSSKNSH